MTCGSSFKTVEVAVLPEGWGTTYVVTARDDLRDRTRQVGSIPRYIWDGCSPHRLPDVNGRPELGGFKPAANDHC